VNYKKTILETIGNTPMVQLHRVVTDIPSLVLLKVETFNPGHSTKDRMALKMVEDAEKMGRIQPGGTFIECTSGNTGMGIAIAAAVKGYKSIFTTSDKQSKEKVDLLKAMGAEVIVCPTNVEPTDPRSYYSVAERLSKEIPNSCWLNQYDNLSNRQAHYESTGPEIWAQTDGKITHLIVGVGTGGTISGTAKYLKEQNPDVKIWGIDTYGSVFKKYKETGIFDEKEIYPYDKDGAVMARRLAREEGILLGYSGGSAVAGLMQLKHLLKPTDVVVVIVHDHGSRYVGKIYNDDWMRERGFLDDEMKVRDLLIKKAKQPFYSGNADMTVRDAMHLMKAHDISQLPIMDGTNVIGSLTESAVLSHLLENPMSHAMHPVLEIMGAPFPMVPEDLPTRQLNRYLTEKIPAVMTYDLSGALHILTKYDIIQSIG
jgi:cystathionine beta-synthase